MSNSFRNAIDDDLQWACERFLGTGVRVSLDDTQGGVNNIVRRVTVVSPPLPPPASSSSLCTKTTTSDNNNRTATTTTYSTNGADDFQHHRHHAHPLFLFDVKVGSQFIIRVYNSNESSTTDDGDDAADSSSSWPSTAKVFFEHHALKHVGVLHNNTKNNDARAVGDGWKVPVPIQQSCLIAKVQAELLRLKEKEEGQNKKADTCLLDDDAETVAVVLASDAFQQALREACTAKEEEGDQNTCRRTSISPEVVRLPKSGLLAAMFPLLPGTLPGSSLAAAGPIGRASGQLAALLSTLDVFAAGDQIQTQLGGGANETHTRNSGTALPPPPPVKRKYPTPTPPYYDIYAAHELMSKAVYHDYVRNSPVLMGSADAQVVAHCQYMLSEMGKLEALVEGLHALGLPRQAIHGDLHYDNVLATTATHSKHVGREASAPSASSTVNVGEGKNSSTLTSTTSLGSVVKVTALLDFEFVAYDWRAMELAICLSKYVSEKDPLPYLQAFIAGWREGCEEENRKHGNSDKPPLYPPFSAAEIDSLTSLIKLRILSNTVFFIGRSIAGEDTIDSLTSRLGAYCKRLEWLSANEEAIKACFSSGE